MAPRTADTTAPALPEILRSPHLATILVPIIDEMCTEAAGRFEAQGLGRYMAAPLAAVRALARETLAYHDLPPSLPSDDPTSSAAGNGRVPEHATAE